MKQGYKSLSELAAALTHNNQGKVDFIAPANAITTAVSKSGSDIVLSVPGADNMIGIGNTGHRQLAEYTNIPSGYYERMRASAPQLLSTSVNRWLEEKGAERRMVRALHGNVRALLSDRYQRIDNYEVAEVALNILSDLPGLNVVSSQITENKMYIKATSNKVVAQVPGSRRVGDLVEAGVMISNSEIGNGSVSVKPFANFLVCLNGMVRDDGKLRAAHIGRRVDADIEGLLTEGTKRLEDEVVLRKVRDVIKHAFDEASFRGFIDKLNATTEQKIKGDVANAVNALGPTVGLSIGERSSVLRHLIEGGDLSKYGLIQAVTRTAEDLDSYDRATELETIGYRIIDLPASQWREVAEARA